MPRPSILLAAALLCLSAWEARAQDYTLQPGDTIEITVLEDPGLNRTVLVRPDGKISLPLAGTLDVEGLTPEAVQSALRRRLAQDFIEAPTVTVSLQGVGQEEALEDVTSIYVLGQVAQPGRIDLEAPVDLLQALAIAGGPSPFAAVNRIQVRRRGPGPETVLLFDYELVEDGLAVLDPIELRDGDVVVVPERGLFE